MIPGISYETLIGALGLGTTTFTADAERRPTALHRRLSNGTQMATLGFVIC